MTSLHIAWTIKLAKSVLVASGIVGVAFVTVDPTVKVAIIAAIPPTISAFVWGWVNHVKIMTVEVNTNSKLTELLRQRDAATTRADRAEGRQEGVDSTKEGSK